VKAASETVRAGETITFSAKFSRAAENIVYNWSISGGEIIEGQGTARIKVATPPEMGGLSLTATVELGGEPICFHAVTGEKTISIER
jgi:hypothetical protein